MMARVVGAWSEVPRHKLTREGRLLLALRKSRDRCRRHRERISHLKQQLHRQQEIVGGWRAKARARRLESEGLREKLGYRDARIAALRDQLREVVADAERLSQQPEDGHKGTPLMVRQIGNGAQPGVFGNLTSEAQEIARR